MEERETCFIFLAYAFNMIHGLVNLFTCLFIFLLLDSYFLYHSTVSVSFLFYIPLFILIDMCQKHRRYSVKKMFLEISQNSQKAPVPESLL